MPITRYEAYLHARPMTVSETAASGHHTLNLGSRRDSYFYIPKQYTPGRPAPFVLLLHGAGGHAQHGLELLQQLADTHGMILLAPASTGHTWDVIIDRAYGTDVALLDQALDHVFHHYAVDPSHLAIGGFSDGASYALSLGLTNGELFTHAIAFSPGFVAPVQARGKPKIFISHGIQDDVLPIGPCSRTIAPRLRQQGYEVVYREFEGGHTIPPGIAQQATEWFLQST